MVTTVYLLLPLLLTSPTTSFPSFQNLLPNGNNVNHPCKANYRWPGLGHENPLGGGVRNSFGVDFERLGNRQWNTALCRADSDGDGRSNGEELGDPDCVWRPGQLPMVNVNISHPGVCQPVDSLECQGKVDFVDCELETFKDCEAINNTRVETLDLTFTRFAVPNTVTNYYCMTFDLPDDQDFHLVAFEPLLDNAEVVHHMLLFLCLNVNATLIAEPESCFMDSPDCFEIVGGWTVGILGICLPPNIGVRFGATGRSRVLLEIHYNNPGLRDDFTDASGLRLYYQPDEFQFTDTGAFRTGQYLLEIPPGKDWFPQVSVCPASCTRALITKPAFIYTAFNHMHYLGRSMKVELFRNGSLVSNLTNDEFYSYDNPVLKVHSPPIQLLPGDEIRTTCVYKSLSKNRWTYFGAGTDDEMCIGFLFVYPKDAMVQGAKCVVTGELSECDYANRTPVHDCDWYNFINATDPQHLQWLRDVNNDCNFNGVCRPECEETLRRVKHPACLTPQMRPTLEYLLAQSSDQGPLLVARLSSCSGDKKATCPEDVRDHANIATMGFLCIASAVVSALVVPND